jgi:tetratricopeptide (TPR) repeat protein
MATGNARQVMPDQAHTAFRSVTEKEAKGEAEQLAKLARDWGKLPERDRARLVEGLERRMSEKDKKNLRLYYLQTNPYGPLDGAQKKAGKGGSDKGGEDMTQARRAKGGEGKSRADADKAEAGKDQKALQTAKAVDEINKRVLLRLEERKKELADLEGKLLKKALGNTPAAGGRKRGGGAAEKTKEDAAPQVWRQDGDRPRFARVYVGDGNSLDLVSLQVSVTVEGPRARTVVDHVFRNPHPRQLEGTFEYPLPAGASPSYFAMFLGQTRDTVPARFRGRTADAPNVAFDALAKLTPAQLVKHVDTTDWGRLQEARVVGKEKALEAYEEVVRGRIDPALMEYASGNTFSGRVFPIPPKGYNRVILSYEELLPVVGDKQLYRFPLPNRKLAGMQFTLQANTAECKAPVFLPDDAKKAEGGGRAVYSRSWTDEEPQGSVLFACRPADPRVQAVSGRDGDSGPRYVYARLRPELKTVAKDTSFASRAVFLLDTSLSENPGRFAVSMKLLRKILENDPAIKEFNVLAFNVGAAWVEPAGWLPNDGAGRQRAFNRLDGVVLEGATDLSSALDKLIAPGFVVPGGTPLDCFLLSDGHITWGEADVNALVSRFERLCPYPTRFHCYRCGLGEENADLYDALTRKGGGTFQCFTEAAVEAASRAHRTQCLQVERVRFVGGPEASDVLVAGRRAAVYPGGELVLAARLAGKGRTTVVVEGKFAGQNVAEEFPLEVRDGGELAARGWGEVAVTSLLALHDPKLDPLVTAYCQQFGIASRAASFLVLENDNDYKRLNLEEERGRTLRGDLAQFIAKAWAEMGKDASPRQLFDRFLRGAGKRVHLLEGPEGPHVKRMLELLKDEDFELPSKPVRGAILRKADVPPSYVAALDKNREDVTAYLTESRRRADKDDVDGAVRALSSVIEVFPARGDALRLVGYRLLDMGQAAQAAQLFRRVQKQRPFEPHSYRDLARSLEESGKYAAAALQYEIVLAGNWHARFRDSLKVVAREEYARMMQEAIRKKALRKELADHFGERLEKMTAPQPKSDLRVTISWNTDATDVDLWVIEPDGTKCFYQHARTKNGGELSQDQTQGYGPERYQVKAAQPGVYTVLVHYYRPNPNLLGGETHVNVSVARQAGTAQEQVERHTVILKKHNQQVEVCKIKF